MFAVQQSTREIRPITKENWGDLASLFECRGGPKYCWCMAWRNKPSRMRDLKSNARRIALKAELHGYVCSGTPVGIVMLEGREAIGWCSVAPRASYRKLGGLAVAGENPACVWSIVCFFVKREFRGSGLVGELLLAAIQYASNFDAEVVEAYPVDPDSPSFRFMGFVRTFERAGFAKVGRAGTRRNVMRLIL